MATWIHCLNSSQTLSQKYSGSSIPQTAARRLTILETYNRYLHQKPHTDARPIGRHIQKLLTIIFTKHYTHLLQLQRWRAQMQWLLYLIQSLGPAGYTTYIICLQLQKQSVICNIHLSSNYATHRHRRPDHVDLFVDYCTRPFGLSLFLSHGETDQLSITYVWPLSKSATLYSEYFKPIQQNVCSWCWLLRNLWLQCSTSPLTVTIIHSRHFRNWSSLTFPTPQPASRHQRAISYLDLR